MTAETLRRAAALMRERAEAASPSPWVQTMWPRKVPGVYSQSIEDTREFDPEIARTLDKPDAAHIASWHPAVALAVARVLENEALVVDDLMRGTSSDAGWALVSPAMEVALTFLGDLDDESFRPERGAE